MARKQAKKPKKPKDVTSLRHDDKRRNIPTAEYQSMLQKEAVDPVRVAYERRNRDLDPQLVWRGKDEQDWSDLVVHAPPLYIQEKVHPKALIDDLLRQSNEKRHQSGEAPLDLFADFNGIPHGVDRTEFYQHDQNWSNRIILGDSLQVMASLAEREGLRGKVQCIYIDPPYGIKFNSNFQWSTTSRDVKDGNPEHITREPEVVKAFRDTWRDGIHSYLTYLRDRLTVARDLLTESGSLFVQIGDENVHLLRCILDEVFGPDQFCSLITFQKTAGANSPQARLNVLGAVSDYVLWYAKSERPKYRQLLQQKVLGEEGAAAYSSLQTSELIRRALTPEERSGVVPLPEGRVFRIDNLTSSGWSDALSQPVHFAGRTYSLSGNLHWKTTAHGISKLIRAGRVTSVGRSLAYIRFIPDPAPQIPSSLMSPVGVA